MLPIRTIPEAVEHLLGPRWTASWNGLRGALRTRLPADVVDSCIFPLLDLQQRVKHYRDHVWARQYIETCETTTSIDVFRIHPDMQIEIGPGYIETPTVRYKIGRLRGTWQYVGHGYLLHHQFHAGHRSYIDNLYDVCLRISADGNITPVDLKMHASITFMSVLPCGLAHGIVFGPGGSDDITNILMDFSVYPPRFSIISVKDKWDDGYNDFGDKLPLSREHCTHVRHA